MISNPRHGSPPRLMVHQPTRFATAQESKPSPSSGIRMNGIVVPGTLRDSLSLLALVLALVLEQETPLASVEIVTDTGAYTDVIFGIFWLLGFQFSPRLADIGGARFWRVGRKANYGPLDGLARHTIKPKLIVQHWGDLLRLARPLKLRLLSAPGPVRAPPT